jgi:hypothetical protein
MVSEAKASCLENKKRLASSRSLIARSRRLLNPAWQISGGADGIDLRIIVRERLASGWLFPAPHKVWAGKGTGHVCIVCGTTIAPAEIEHEVVGPATTVWTHLPCYSIWREESQDHERANGTNGTDYLADLRQIVRNRFADGTLFVLPHDKSWTGLGVSDICAVCSKPIFAAESSHEVLAPTSAHAHLVCYRAWLIESIATRLEERSSAEPHDDAL